jgi:3-hydroxyisobutyrate dehydrogenase-like beta-hydroxyacid dehydrogenase
VNRRIGFIGLGVMGAPMCRKLALKSDDGELYFPVVSRLIGRKH